MHFEICLKIDSILRSHFTIDELSPLLLLLRSVPSVEELAVDPCHSLPLDFEMTAPAIFKPPTPTTVEEPPMFLSAHYLDIHFQMIIFKFRGQQTVKKVDHYC